MGGELGKASSARMRRALFLDHLDQVFGKAPEVHVVEGDGNDQGDVLSIIYRDYPESGYLTAITYGLSERPAGQVATKPTHGQGLASDAQRKVELVLCLRSENTDFPLVLAEVASQLKTSCQFVYGDVLDCGNPISDQTSMTGYVLFAPSVLDPSQWQVSFGSEDQVELVGAYPVFDGEAEFMQRHGLQAWFRDPRFEMYSTGRMPVIA